MPGLCSLWPHHTLLQLWCHTPHLTLLLLALALLMSSSMVSWAQILPRFSPDNSNTLRVQEGDRATLNCKIQGMNNQISISWIRQSDLQILSVGNLQFSSDSRIEIVNDPRSGDFSLVINRIRKEDEGFYECHINVIPIKSFLVKLSVVEKQVASTDEYLGSDSRKRVSTVESHDPSSGSSTEILGAPDIYFYPGTLVNLTCIVTSPREAGRIFWYHQGRVISYYSARKGVSIVMRGDGDVITISNLLLREATTEDEGTYVCRPEKPFMKSAKTRLFIIDGTRSEASRTSEANTQSLYLLLLLLNIFSIFQ